MAQEPLVALIGSTVLQHFHLLRRVWSDDSLPAYQASDLRHNTPAIIRISLAIELQPDDDQLAHAAFQRAARHAVGISALHKPLSTGPVQVGGRRLLAVAHAARDNEHAANRIASNQPVPLDVLVAWLERLSGALGALHDQGVVHGAIHPAAIAIGPDGVSLGAFGLSHVALALGGPGAARDVLPPRSRTPEQLGIVPKAPSQESDAFALALVGCELLAGAACTSATSVSEIVRRIDHSVTRPTPRALMVQVPDGVEQAFFAALQPDPRERTNDPRSFVRQLHQPAGPVVPEVAPPVEPLAIEPQADEAKAPPAPEARPEPAPAPTPTPSPPQKKPPSEGKWLVWGLIGGGLLLLVGGIAAGFYVVAAGIKPFPGPGPATTPTVALPPVPVLDAGVAPPPAPPEPDAAVAAPGSAPLNYDKWPRPAPGRSAVSAEDQAALIPLDPSMAIIGSPDALVTIVLFADMHCPHTKAMRPVLEQQLDRHGSKVRVAVRHLPLAIHPSAEVAAELGAATTALAGPIAFWKLFVKISDTPTETDEARLSEWAVEAGASRSALESALTRNQFAPVLDRDATVAGQLMVRGTPTVFINGNRINGMKTEAFISKAVLEELQAARLALASGTPNEKLYASRVRFNVTSAAADRD